MSFKVPSIQYLQQHQINKEKWDVCIDKASNGLIYAYSNYLDNMADSWDALVLNDYEAVMPLPWRKKWGMYYLYQPFLTAQLGVFGSILNKELFVDFLRAVPKKFRLWEFSFNHQNLFAVKEFPLYTRTNYVLSLNQSYENIYKSYRENIRRNCKKSRNSGSVVKKDIPVDAIFELTKLQAKDVVDKNFQNFENLFNHLKEKGRGKTYGIVAKSGELLASAAFVFSHNRAYYILVGNHPNGRTLGASHALIDTFIQDHANQNLVLDFEGSDIRNLAFFYGSFGAKEEKYAAIKLNCLPQWIRWMK